MKPFTVLNDITVRQWRPEDADAVLLAVKENYDHLREYMHWATPDYSIDDAREFIMSGLASAGEKKSCGLGIFRGERVIGSIDFVKFDQNSRRTEIGYWISKAEEGKGIITRICRVLIDHAFNELGMNRVEIRCAADNTRSAAVAERLGFAKEGVLRQSEMRNGRLHDFRIYGLLAAEWSRTE